MVHGSFGSHYPPSSVTQQILIEKESPVAKPAHGALSLFYGVSPLSNSQLSHVIRAFHHRDTLRYKTLFRFSRVVPQQSNQSSLESRMATLNLASKANQATTFPALMVAHYAKEADPNSAINVIFEEIDTLKAADNATVEVVVGSGTSTYGFQNVIDSLVEAYPFLQGKHDTLVKAYQVCEPICNVNAALGQRMDRKNSNILPHRL